MPRKTTPKLSEALGEYMEIRSAHLAKTTLANDQALLRKFVREVGDPQTHLLTARTVERWFAGEAKRQQASSYNKVRARVSGFMQFCTRRGWLDTDPLGEVRTRRVQKRDRLRLSGPQLRAMFEATENPRDRAMLATASLTGLRAGDLTRLTVGSVDLDERWIHVEIQKTGDVDNLRINDELEPELRTYLSWYAKRMAKKGLPLSSQDFLFPALGPIFTSYDDNHHRMPWGDPVPTRQQKHPARVVQKALMRIGIEQTAQEGFHTIRRSVGRLFFDLAADEGHDGALRVASALLGHKSVVTTEGYIGVSADRVKRDQLMMGRSLLGAPDTANVRAIR